MNHVVRMCDLSFDPKLFETFHCGTALDELGHIQFTHPVCYSYFYMETSGLPTYQHYERCCQFAKEETGYCKLYRHLLIWKLLLSNTYPTHNIMTRYWHV